jgi:hypothetical protein
MTAKQPLERIRGSKILSIQDYDRIQPIDRGGWAQVDAPMTDYDREYPEKLMESLGLKLVLVRSGELIQEIERAEKFETERIADRWIEEAEEVKNVTREDVIRSAELYVAYRRLLERYDAHAITVSSWALIPDGKIKAMPPLAEMELAKELVPCCCESLIDCTVTQMIGTYVSGRPGFVGDVLNTWGGLVPMGTPPENLVIVGHCYGPINPHGDDRVGYVIRDHVVYNNQVGQGWMSSWRPDAQVQAARQLEREHVTLVGITVRWPLQEVATIAKFDVYSKRVSVCTGTTIDGRSIFEDFDDRLCRTKIAVKTEVPFRNAVGGHQVVFYGDHSARIKDLARLAGFEVMDDGQART